MDTKVILNRQPQLVLIQERVMVCISTYPHSSQLLRRGARLASQMRVRLYALYPSSVTLRKAQHFPNLRT